MTLEPIKLDLLPPAPVSHEVVVRHLAPRGQPKPPVATLLELAGPRRQVRRPPGGGNIDRQVHPVTEDAVTNNDRPTMHARAPQPCTDAPRIAACYC